MSDSEFFDFDKALDKLSIEEDDLKRLISAGEIRAFREGSKMRLRAEDVDRVAADIGAVDESDAGEILEVEEVSFDDADDGMGTVQLSEEDTLLDEELGLEEVEMDEDLSSPVRGGSSRGVSATRGATRAAPEPEVKESTGMLFATIITTALMVYGMAFVFAALSARSTGLTDGLVGFFAGE